MRIIFRTRPLKFLFLKNWYGIRKGDMWVYYPETYAFMVDAGIVTFGYAV